jgi:hypothetical protein
VLSALVVMVSGDPGLLDLFIAGVGYLVSIYFEVDSQLLIIIDIYIYVYIYKGYN